MHINLPSRIAECVYLRSHRLLEISHNGNSSDRVVCFGLYGLRLFSLFCFVLFCCCCHCCCCCSDVSLLFWFAFYAHNLWNVLFALHIERLFLYGNSNRFTWWLEWAVCKMRTCAPIGNSFPIDVNWTTDAPELNAIEWLAGGLAGWLWRQMVANCKCQVCVLFEIADIYVINNFVVEWRKFLDVPPPSSPSPSPSSSSSSSSSSPCHVGKMLLLLVSWK